MAGRSTQRGEGRNDGHRDARAASQVGTLGHGAHAEPAEDVGAAAPEVAAPEDAAPSQAAAEEGAPEAAAKIVLPAEDAAPDAASKIVLPAEDAAPPAEDAPAVPPPPAPASGAATPASAVPAGDGGAEASPAGGAASEASCDGTKAESAEVVPPMQTPGSEEPPPVVAAEAHQVPCDDTARRDTGRPPPGVLCRVSSVGSVSGHGVRPDGRAAEFWPSGSVGYFSEAAVKKLPHMLIALS
jgi:hypothetical protein